MKKTSQKGVRSTALMGILDEGNNISDAGILDIAWKGAEAYQKAVFGKVSKNDMLQPPSKRCPGSPRC